VSRPVADRGRIEDLSRHQHVIGFLGDEQHITIAQHNIGGTVSPILYLRLDVDDDPPDGSILLKLVERNFGLPDRRQLCIF
jgi:hypothetical protein